ncbi:MAG TPA: glycosyltransferase family 39 protein [Bryobacteraceae bacterium]|nr:glycosyltransferase family 39 protein [Bryobacteraceae bacterium]
MLQDRPNQPPHVAEKLLWLACTVIAGAAIVATLVYPFAKGVLIGIAPVLVGLGFAIASITFSFDLTKLSRMLDCSPGKWMAGLCLSAAVIRLPLVVFPARPVSDFLSYYESAKALANGIGHLSVYYPPGQPAWLSVWFVVFGDHLRLLVFAQCLLSLASIPMLYVALRPVNELGARMASAAIAFFPSIVLLSGTLAHETTQIFLLSVLLLVYRRAAESRGFVSLLYWASLGIVTGAIAMVRPTFLAIVPLIVVVELLRRQSIALTALRAAVIVILMGAIIAPWSIRNYRIYNRFCLISANAGINLLGVTHPKSNGIFYDVGNLGSNLNEVDRDKYFMQLAISSIKADPWRIVRLGFKKIIWMWGADSSMVEDVVGLSDSPLKRLLQAIDNTFWAWLVTVWFIGALVARPWQSRHPGTENLICSWVLLLFLLHALFEPQARHHVPVIPLILGICGPSYLALIVRRSEKAALAGSIKSQLLVNPYAG